MAKRTSKGRPKGERAASGKSGRARKHAKRKPKGKPRKPRYRAPAIRGNFKSFGTAHTEGVSGEFVVRRKLPLRPDDFEWLQRWVIQQIRAKRKNFRWMVATVQVMTYGPLYEVKFARADEETQNEKELSWVPSSAYDIVGHIRKHSPNDGCTKNFLHGIYLLFDKIDKFVGRHKDGTKREHWMMRFRLWFYNVEK